MALHDWINKQLSIIILLKLIWLKYKENIFAHPSYNKVDLTWGLCHGVTLKFTK